MKKTLLVIILFLLVIQGFSQYKPVLFGLRAAGNIGWIKPDTEEYSSEGVKAGFTWGFISEFFFMENYAVLTGFNMNFNGGKLEYPYWMSVPGNDTLEKGTMHREYSLKYIQIPICLKMQTELNEKLKIFGKIGIGTAFNLSAKGTDKFVYDEGEINKDKTNIDEDIHLMRESLIVGGGVEFKIKGSTAVIVELTYDNAFNNLLTGDDPGYGEYDPKAIHNFVEIGAGIVF